MKLLRIPNIILGAVDDHGDYDGDDIYNGDAMITIKIMNGEYIWATSLHFTQCE